MSEMFCLGKFSVILPRKKISGNLVVDFGNLKYVSIIIDLPIFDVCLMEIC